ncbi:hypothetical protein WN55_01614 [Dufourea novaeangliae]|uniref:Uncharacterized protein n=1 Tax=Dufourea novaeangliae TaxID=178035 RepID=A0A154PGC5_DUFNO|nr:hypothetical protein WN55_01614 [Dufourea novaeangliae]
MRIISNRPETSPPCPWHTSCDDTSGDPTSRSVGSQDPRISFRTTDRKMMNEASS